MWLHILGSPGTCKLLCSPDTDVYHIGLPLVDDHLLEVYVRVSMFSSQEHRYLNLDHILTSLRDDPDLSSIPRDILPKVIQTIFICTGCDYVSYFAGLLFLSIFFSMQNSLTPHLLVV